MTDRDYTAFAEDCPNRIMIAVRGKSAKLIDYCGTWVEGFCVEMDMADSDWDVPADGFYVADVHVESWQTWTDYGYEHDASWEPHDLEPISDEMWARYVADEHVWPSEYYALEQRKASE